MNLIIGNKAITEQRNGLSFSLLANGKNGFHDTIIPFTLAQVTHNEWLTCEKRAADDI